MSKTALLLLLTLVLPACASTGTTSALPAEATLTPGHRIALSDRAQLEYVGTFDDSRCPPDVQCIHAGDARVLLRIAENGDSRDVVLAASRQGEPRQSGTQPHVGPPSFEAHAGLVDEQPGERPRAGADLAPPLGE